MNRDPEQRTKLLAELFHDDWETGPASHLARAAAAQARRRHQVRQALVTAGATAGLAAVFVFTFLHQARPPVRTTAPTRATPAYEIISDEELMARLHDRPLLVLRKENGTREFVFPGP